MGAADGARGVSTAPPPFRQPKIFLLLALITASMSCREGPPQARIRPTYDPRTGKLGQLTYDSDNDGKSDTWSYMDGTQVLRIEIDKDEDGRIDRWEYYSPDGKLEKAGISRVNDGKPDTWLFSAPDCSIGKIELSLTRDGQVDRTEYYSKGVLVRAEQDSNRDGRIDKWETYDERGTLTSVAFDTTGRGVPDRRLIYRADGSLERADPVLPSSAPAPAPR